MPGKTIEPSGAVWPTAAARGATRGFLGDVLVRAIHIITGTAEDKAANFVASKVVQAFDSQVNPGVYELKPHKLE